MTRLSCSPEMSPGRRLREFPITFTINALFIKLSHCRVLVRSHAACGDRPKQEKRSTPRNAGLPPRASLGPGAASLGRAGPPSSQEHLGKLRFSHSVDPSSGFFAPK